MINNPSDSLNMQTKQDRNAFNFFYQQSNTKTALNPKGALIKRNPIEKAGAAIRNTGKDVVNLTNAIKNGEGDDFSLGRLNDLGMKLGGLGIASYLITRRNTPRTKMMEIAGPVIFFSMMSLWQKLFVALPLKARFGVDINQKYTDSQGREKELYLDNQYVPNLRTKEEKQKLADRLHLPKEMEYRDEYAEEKARRIALQGRTLGLLTAGPAVPVLTALICNKIEGRLDNANTDKRVHDMVDKIRYNTNPPPKTEDMTDYNKWQSQNQELFKDFLDKRIAKHPLADAKGRDIIKRYKGYSGPVDDKLFRGIADAFNPGIVVEDSKILKQMVDVSDDIAKDFKAMFAAGIDEDAAVKDVMSLFTRNAVENGTSLTMKIADAAAQGGVTEGTISRDTLEGAVRSVISKVRAGEIEYDGKSMMEALSSDKNVIITITEAAQQELDPALVKELTDKRIKEIAMEQGISKKQARAIVEKGDDVLQAAINEAKKTLGSVTTHRNLTAIPSSLTSEDYKVFREFIENGKKAQLPAFMKKVEANFNAASDLFKNTVAMEDMIKYFDNSFGKEYFTLVDSVFEVVKPDRATLEKLRSNSKFAADYFRNALETVAADDELYKSLIEKIKNAPSVDESARDIFVEYSMRGFWSRIGEIRRRFDPSLKTVSDFSSFDVAHTRNSVGRYAETYLAKALPGIDATKNRLLLGLDLERRIKDGTLKTQWDELQLLSPVEETFENFVEHCRRIIFQSTPNDFANSHYMAQNGEYYERLNDILFNRPLDKNTVAALGSESLVDKLNQMRISMMAIGTATKDYTNPANNLLNDGIIKDDALRGLFNEVKGDTSCLRYQKVGKPIKDFIFENAGQKYNTKTWLKMFGIFGAALIGVTFLAQLFIGTNKDKHLYMKKKAPVSPQNPPVQNIQAQPVQSQPIQYRPVQNYAPVQNIPLQPVQNNINNVYVQNQGVANGNK